MKVEQLIINPSDSLIYMERYVNDGSPSGFTWKNQSSVYTSPRSDFPYFFLDEVKFDHVIDIGAYPKTVPFHKNIIYLHPDMSTKYDKITGYMPNKSNLMVSATSSSRTVKLLNYPGYIKLNYNGIIGRIDRSLNDTHAYMSVEMTDYLCNKLFSSIYKSLCFFAEPFSRFIRDGNFNFGMVYRDERPIGLLANKIKIIIPMFSLFSKDIKQLNDDYLLIQLIEFAKSDPIEYILRNIIFPIIDNYFSLILYEGLQPEWHAQNLLLGLDENLSVVSIIMRDLESIDIDQTIRENLGDKLSFSFFPYKHINSNQYNYSIKHSFMYDHKIGEYLFDPIIRCISKYYNINKTSIEKEIKTYSQKYTCRLPIGFFPDKKSWYSFENVLIDRNAPVRPYKINYGIKYRG